MSYIGNQGEQNTSTEVSALTNLVSYPVENLSSQITGSNKLFTTSHTIIVVIWATYNGAMIVESVDFTKSGDQITLITFTPAVGEQIFIKYA